jgi:EAL domain-containing protein (putative c-di-GMP-specific phosphodiesterase class I)
VAQGYLYARPMPGEELSDWILSRQAVTAGFVVSE